MIMCKTYTKEDFDEDCPRFIKKRKRIPPPL